MARTACAQPGCSSHEQCAMTAHGGKICDSRTGCCQRARGLHTLEYSAPCSVQVAPAPCRRTGLNEKIGVFDNGGLSGVAEEYGCLSQIPNMNSTGCARARRAVGRQRQLWGKVRRLKRAASCRSQASIEARFSHKRSITHQTERRDGGNVSRPRETDTSPYLLTLL